MRKYFVKNLTANAITIVDGHREILVLQNAGDRDDREPVPLRVLDRPDFQRLWAGGKVAVYADEAMEALIERPAGTMSSSAQEADVAVMIRGGGPVAQALRELIGEGGGEGGGGGGDEGAPFNWGEGAPASGISAPNGAAYIDVTTGETWRNESGTWVKVELEVNIGGGPTIKWGTGEPPANLNAPRDSLYIDQSDPSDLKLWRMQ